MQSETISIVTSKEKFFLEYLTLKKPIIDSVLTKINRKKTTLSDKPLKVLAKLLYYNDLYKDETEDHKWNKVFSKEVKDIIGTDLGLKEHHLNNYISQLRTIKILDGKKIRPLFVIYAKDDLTLNFKFHLNGHS